MKETFGSYGDFSGLSAEEIQEMSEEDQISIIVEWFRHQFEDPQNETPYNNELGGYVYMWGGPFDASDQIQDEFSNVIDFDTMMQAVNEVQSDGTVEWAPRTRGDFYEHPDDDRVASGEIVDGDGEWPPIIADQQQAPPETEARSEVLRRLDELEDRIQPVFDLIQADFQAPPMMGHNNPPEKMEIFHAVPRNEWLEVREAINQIRQQTEADHPDTEILERGRNRFLTVAQVLAGWIAGRVNKAVDTGISVGIGVAIAQPEATKIALINAADAIGNWIASLPLLF